MIGKYTINADRDGELSLYCPRSGCWVMIPVEQGATIEDLQARSAEHEALHAAGGES